MKEPSQPAGPEPHDECEFDPDHLYHDAPWAAAAKLVAEILTRYGLDCPTPDDGDLDDVEVERWAACCEVAERVTAAERERCARIARSRIGDAGFAEVGYMCAESIAQEIERG